MCSSEYYEMRHWLEQKAEKYRVTDKEVIIKVNAIWQQILNR